MAKFARLQDWPIDQAPFLYMSKDDVLSRLLREWTTLDTGQIQETAGIPFHEDADEDSDSDGGASTATGFSERELLPNKEQAARQPLKHEAERSRTRAPGPRPLPERFGTNMGRVPHAEPSWYGYKDNSSNHLEASYRHHDFDPSRRVGQRPAPTWAQPGFSQRKQPPAQTHGSFNWPDPRRREEVLPITPSTFHPQVPTAPCPPPEEWISFTETTGNGTGESRAPCNPSRPSIPRNHNNPERRPVVKSHGVKQASYNGEDRARHLTEIRKSPSPGKGDVPIELSVDSQTHTMAKEDKDLNQTRSLAEIQAEISQLEAILQHPKDQMERRPSTAKSTTRICDENDTVPAGMVDEVGSSERAIVKSSKDTTLQTDHDLEAWRSELKAQIREEVDMEFRRQQELQETYNQTFERQYADLKRHEAEEQHLIDKIKEQTKAEFIREQEAANKLAQEDERLRERLRRIAEADNEHIEARQPAFQGHDRTDECIQQFRDLSQNDFASIDEESLIQNDVQQHKTPHVGYDIMSFLAEGTETTSTSSSSSSADSKQGDNSDGSEVFKAKSTIGNKEQGNLAGNSDVERSQPWKGPAHLGSFIELTPFYLRGSDAGQTWYHGAEPIYIVEFQKGYDGETATCGDAGGQPYQRPYLLVSQLWVDAEALDRFGFKYSEGPPSHYFLDPRLSWGSLEVLVNFTYALREVKTFKTHSRAWTSGTRFFCRSPPPMEFFATSDSRAALGPSLGGQRQHVDAPEGEKDAEEKPRSLTKRFKDALNVLNFAMHTIT